LHFCTAVCDAGPSFYSVTHCTKFVQRDALRQVCTTQLTTNIHAPGGIRTHDRSREVAVDLRLRQRGPWDHRTALWPRGVPRNFFRGRGDYTNNFFLGGGGGVSTNSVGDRENGDLGAVAP
jgi:hypothetical protein